MRITTKVMTDLYQISLQKNHRQSPYKMCMKILHWLNHLNFQQLSLNQKWIQMKRIQTMEKGHYPNTIETCPIYLEEVKNKKPSVHTLRQNGTNEKRDSMSLSIIMSTMSSSTSTCVIFSFTKGITSTRISWSHMTC